MKSSTEVSNLAFQIGGEVVKDYCSDHIPDNHREEIPDRVHVEDDVPDESANNRPWKTRTVHAQEAAEKKPENKVLDNSLKVEREHVVYL